MSPVEVVRGDGPIILGLPHTGTDVPSGIQKRLNLRGRGLDDTDWHIERLYDGLLDNVTTVRATFHRYVIDANRNPNGSSLYPGQNTTELVPLTDFYGNDIWNAPPTKEDVEARKIAFHTPYHAALHTEIARVRAVHGVAILYDCHSIRSKIPYLFGGTLPDFNIGTNLGKTCDARVESAVQDICVAADGYSNITNGRFQGGWTTRHYGQPNKDIHAIQMELSQSTYLSAEAAPWAYDEARADALRLHLKKILTALHSLASDLSRKDKT